MKHLIVKQVDLRDGGDRQEFGFFIDASVSNEAIKGAHPHCYVHTKSIKVYDTLAEVKEYSTKELRKSAWAKLSTLEREALGMLEEPK